MKNRRDLLAKIIERETRWFEVLEKTREENTGVSRHSAAAVTRVGVSGAIATLASKTSRGQGLRLGESP